MLATPPSTEDRRTFLGRLRAMYAPLVLPGAGSYAYGSVLERHRLTVERHHLTIPLGVRGPKALRAVSLTDFHFDPLHEEGFIAECVHRTNALKPDVIFLTGDYISRSSRRIADFAAVLGGLCPTAGVFACLGNHDYEDHVSRVVAALRKNQVDVLINRHTRVPCAGGELVVAGLESVWESTPNWNKASSGLKSDDRVLALMHEPDFANTLAHDPRIAMQFSGHTHGGQIRLPGIGALRLPSWGQIYQAGFYDVRQIKLYVNRGIGTIRHHVRLFCPPEIACFDLVNADAV